jgi:hypothetical protein
MDAATRKYLADIGRRGGKAGAGTPLRRAIAKKAAAARWGKTKKRRRQNDKLTHGDPR